MSRMPLPKLPIGIQTFADIRTNDYLYVDKTKYLINIIDSGKVFFLSRPRRFGKSLTISTFDALFSGKKELFEGLYAEEFFNRPGYKTSPVVRLDMSGVTTNRSADELEASMLNLVRESAWRYDLSLEASNPADALRELLARLAHQHGPVVVLIDEYDKPILDVLHDMEKAEAFRAALRNLYSQIKSKDEQIRFVFMTGITKFTKTGVFSAMNNLKDISLHDRYAEMLGYTEGELSRYFKGYITRAADELALSEEALIERVREYYDGFSFDGVHRVYNPFSTLNFFDDITFRNYWFESGSPSFIINYIQKNGITVEDYRGFVVMSDFASQEEIERAQPASFLFQAGYLTFKGRLGEGYILDYPNLEVLSSISRLYAANVYALGERYGSFGLYLKEELNQANINGVIEILNRALAAIPYNLFSDSESFYHSVFLTLLWGAGIIANAEEITRKGRSDIVITHRGRVYVMELKVTDGAQACERVADEAMAQIRAKGYADRYDPSVTTLVSVAIDTAQRQIAAFRVEGARLFRTEKVPN